MFKNNKIILFKKILILFLFTFVFAISSVKANEYSYNSIDVNIKINQDSTFDVEEHQFFNYIGEFHAGWRSISLGKIDQISDIEVIDGKTGMPLIYSYFRKNKTDPTSWGKFTYYKDKGFENIEWYYNLSDTSHEWIIKYKVHGGIGFYEKYDELYWNIFTNYEIPIKKSSAYVILPDAASKENILIDAWRNEQQKIISQSFLDNNKTFFFESYDFNPEEDFTIKVSWPKGIVSQAAYEIDFLKINIYYILEILITFINITAILILWYFREKNKKGRGTIIPQYAPPENLRPAMAQVILKERVTSRGWSATVVDLAIRGYIKIKEDKCSQLYNTKKSLFIAFSFVFLLFFILFISDFALATGMAVVLSFLFFFILVLIFLIKFADRKSFNQIFSKTTNDYILEKINGKDESSLENYEKEFLNIIFKKKSYFSTKEVKKANKFDKIEMYELMEELKSNLYKATNTNTNAFEVGVDQEKIGEKLFFSIPFAIFIYFIAEIIPSWNNVYFLACVILFNIVGFYAYYKYEARLSKKGLLLREDWLGFKMYLETAERYRMQNLTPETFEKYLPYAIIFGVEKQRGRAFDSLNMQNPYWYSGYIAGPSAFSTSAFSSSFSSSFSSAFASSGGGGGGAGGGGGGGGGGAS
ncbi:MAG: DUF2207 domain-containing protein [bacterium]